MLYQIIKSAEQYSNVETLPFRAIFAAYDKVLAQHGLNPDRDQVYLRFLFKLGDKKRPGESLYHCFEALLGEAGIRIEIDSNEDHMQDVSTRLEDFEAIESRNRGAAAALANVPTPRRSRRASFESFYDANEDSIRPIGLLSKLQVPTSPSHIDRSIFPMQRPSTRATTRPTEKTQKQRYHHPAVAAWTDTERLTAKQFASNFPLHNPISTNDLKQASTQAPANAILSTPRRLSSPAKISNAADPSGKDLVKESENDELAYTINRDGLFYRPSETQLMRDVDTFQHYRVRHIARAVLQKWSALAFRSRIHTESMERQASVYDVEALLRQGLQQWRARLRQKRKALETKRFFGNLERRASKARDLYLLTKAFTHWAQITSDHVMRTSTVRQHLLGLKYFNAWYQITIVNDMKVSQHKLVKYFRIWKQSHNRTRESGCRAMVFYNESLVKLVYWRWCWAFSERRAPEWRAAKLKRKIFLQWASHQQNQSRKRQLVYDVRTEKIAHWSFWRWLESTRAMRSRLEQAQHFSRQNRFRRALSAWKLRHKYAPSVQKLTNMVDWRVAGTTFAVIVTRYRTGRQAEVVDRLRVLRKAWTSWNDALRQDYLTKKINDRVLIEQLYRWALAQRCGLVHRVRERRLKERFISKLAIALAERIQHRAVACQKLEVVVRQNCLKMVFSHWQSQMAVSLQREQLAFQFHAPRIAQEILQKWSAENAHLQKLHIEAEKAARYLTATKFIKSWHTALVESRRLRRREGYIQVRRKIKMDLAGRVLRQWRDLTVERLQNKEQALAMNQTRLLDFASNLFDTWRSRSNLAQSHNTQASQHYAVTLAAQHLQQWSDRCRQNIRLDELAHLNDDMRMSGIAFNWLHRLRLRAIEVRGREANAQSLRSFYEKRHVQALLRRWRDSAMRESHGTTQKPTPARSRPLYMSFVDDRAAESTPIRTRGSTLFAKGFDTNDWTHASEANQRMTPQPGYPNTPAKRAAWVKSQMAVSTTPAGTPFQQRIRAYMSTAPRSQRRTELGRASNLRESGFGAILEASPRTPGTE